MGRCSLMCAARGQCSASSAMPGALQHPHDLAVIEGWVEDNPAIVLTAQVPLFSLMPKPRES